MARRTLQARLVQALATEAARAQLALQSPSVPHPSHSQGSTDFAARDRHRRGVVRVIPGGPSEPSSDVSPLDVPYDQRRTRIPAMHAASSRGCRLLVKTSASCSDVSTRTERRRPVSTASSTKCFRMSTCFARSRPPITLLLHSMHALLSSNTSPEYKLNCITLRYKTHANEKRAKIDELHCRHRCQIVLRLGLRQHNRLLEFRFPMNKSTAALEQITSP